MLLVRYILYIFTMIHSSRFEVEPLTTRICWHGPIEAWSYSVSIGQESFPSINELLGLLLTGSTGQLKCASLTYIGLQGMQGGLLAANV